MFQSSNQQTPFTFQYGKSEKNIPDTCKKTSNIFGTTNTSVNNSFGKFGTTNPSVNNVFGTNDKMGTTNTSVNNVFGKTNTYAKFETNNTYDKFDPNNPVFGTTNTFKPNDKFDPNISVNPIFGTNNTYTTFKPNDKLDQNNPVFGTNNTYTNSVNPTFGTTNNQVADDKFGQTNTNFNNQGVDDKFGQTNTNFNNQFPQSLIEYQLKETNEITKDIKNIQLEILQQLKHVENMNEYSHENIFCNSCKKNNIKGIRYKCISCYNYDLCDICESQKIHNYHFFIKINNSIEFTNFMKNNHPDVKID